MSKKAKVPKVRFSASGAWARAGVAKVWVLQEDTRFVIYKGDTKETKGQWFLLERTFGFFIINPKVPIPHFLGSPEGLDEALDLADAEIARRRFEGHAQEQRT